MQPGDLVAILKDSGSPFVLHPVEKGYFELVGESYVHGIKDGEFIKDETKVELIELKKITLRVLTYGRVGV